MLGIGLGITSRLRSSVFNPASLFRNNEQGWFYDLSDMSTLFQDAAGITPVTAVNQPVGLCLDKSKGLVLGSELVATGLTGTPIAAKWTLTGNRAVLVGALAAEAAGITFNGLTGTNGATYRVDVTVYSVAGDSYSFRLPDNSTIGQKTGPQSFSFRVRADGTTALIRMLEWNGNLTDIDFEVVVRELPGNHRRQSASLPRPTYARHPLGGIRNLLTFTEQFDNAAWVKTSLTVTANTHTAPDGTQTADTLTDASTGFALCSQSASIFSLTNTALLSIRKDSVGRATRFPAVRINYTGGTAVFFDLYLDTLTGEFITTAGGVGEVISDGDYWRVKLTATGNTGNTAVDMRVFPAVGASATWVTSATAEGSIVAWGAYLGPIDGPYQRVVSRFDVTEAGQPDLYYLAYDGSDDCLSTPAFAWGSDKATICAGVRKLSDEASGIVAEISANSGTSAGAFQLSAPWDGTFRYGFRSNGTVSAPAVTTSTTFNAPITNVLTGLGDISGDRATLRIDGNQVAQATTDQGNGNFGTHQAFFGARAGTSAFFNGREYSNFAINRLLTANELSQIERYTAQRTGVTIP